MKIHCLLLVFLAFAGTLLAQNDGEYRSIASGTWHGDSTWERYVSTTQEWLPAAISPKSVDGIVTIRSPHIIQATITVSAIDEVIIDSGATLIISDQFVLVDGPGADIACFGTLEHTAGMITGLGIIDIYNRMIWTGGTLAVCVTVNNASTLFIDSATSKNINTDLVISTNAVVTWNGGTINFDSGKLFNYGTINNSFDGALNNISETSYFFNYGSFNKTGGAGTTTDNLWVGNEESGHFNIYSGTYSHTQRFFENFGQIHIDSGCTFTNNDSAYFKLNDTPFSGTGTLIFSGASVNNFDLPVEVPAGMNFIFSGGILTKTNNGKVEVKGTMNWTEGNIVCPISIINSTLSVNGSAVKILCSELNVGFGSVMNWDAGTISFKQGFLFNYGTINNSFNGSLFGAAGENRFYSTGTFNKTGGSGSTTENLSGVYNGGSFNINSGSFNHTAGLFENNGTMQIAQGCRFGNSDTLQFGEQAFLQGTGTLNLSAGSHVFEKDIVAPAGSKVILSGGTAAGSGSLFIDGTMTWGAGTIECPVTIGMDDTLTLFGTAVKNLNDTLLLNKGAIMHWTGGNINFNDALLFNSGTINNSFDGTMNNNAGSNTFYNDVSGIFNKTGAVAATATNLTSTINHGLFNINAGTFNNADHIFDNHGTIHINTGAFFNNTATMNFYGPSNLTGNGTLALSSGNHHFEAMVSTAPARFTVNLAGGVFDGPGGLAIYGNMSWTAGNIKAIVQINNRATLNVSGAASKLLESSLYIQEGGVMNWNQGDINFNNGSLYNYGTVNNNFDGLINHSAGVNTLSIGPGGVFKKTATGGGETTCSVPAVNEGTIKGIGTLAFSVTLDNKGSIAPGLSPGILAINGDGAMLDSSSQIIIEIKNAMGAGTGHDMLQHTGNLNKNGTIQVIETGIVPNGTYEIISLAGGIFSGNFTTVELPPDYMLLTTNSTISVVKNLSTGNFYRSLSTGEWTDSTTWEISADGINWANSPSVPSNANSFVTIKNSHSVTISSIVSAGKIYIESGGALNISSGALNIIQ